VAAKGWPVAEITNRKEFLDWLENKPIEWVRVLAMRAALRVLPLDSGVFDSDRWKLKVKQDIVLSVYRALAITWVASRFPNHNMVMYARSAAVTNDVASSAIATIIVSDPNSVSSTSAADTVSFAIATIDAAAAHAVFSPGVWATLNADIRFLQECGEDPQTAARSLAGKAVWFSGKIRTSSQEWHLNATSDFERFLFQLNNNWHVWCEWYRSLCNGNSVWGLSANKAEDLIVRITTQDKDFWDRGATEVNVEIARWLEEIRAEEGERKNGVKKTNLTASDIVTDLVAAIQKARVNHDHLVLTSAMLRMEIDEFKEKLRGDNELDPGLRDKLTTLLDNHAEAVEEMIAITEELPENISDDDVNKFKPWFDTYVESVKNEFPRYTDPKKFGKATIPAIIVGLSASVGLMFGMPAIFGAGALTMMGFNPAAKTIKEILKKDGGEK